MSGYFGPTAQIRNIVQKVTNYYVSRVHTEGQNNADGKHPTGKKIILGVCAREKKTKGKPMQTVLNHLAETGDFEIIVFTDECILNQPVEEWPPCEALISFFSSGFPIHKALEYVDLVKPFLVNDLESQKVLMDRRSVYALLEANDIPTPRYAVLERDEDGNCLQELKIEDDCIFIDNLKFVKPFVEKPIDADDHNIRIYFPVGAGGGSQHLFRKIGNKSSQFVPDCNEIRSNGSYIIEEFQATEGTDVKVYTVGGLYAHAEARKSPAVDGMVQRTKDGKEVRFPVLLDAQEKLIARKVSKAFKQMVCGFDFLRTNGESMVCDVNGWSFVKGNAKYFEDTALILRDTILRDVCPDKLQVPLIDIRDVPASQVEEEGIMSEDGAEHLELRCVLGVFRHSDRTPKQKMKMLVTNQQFLSFFNGEQGQPTELKIKKPTDLQKLLDLTRQLLSMGEGYDSDIEERLDKLMQMRYVLEKGGHFSGINRKVQIKALKHRRTGHRSPLLRQMSIPDPVGTNSYTHPKRAMSTPFGNVDKTVTNEESVKAASTTLSSAMGNVMRRESIEPSTFKEAGCLSVKNGSSSSNTSPVQKGISPSSNWTPTSNGATEVVPTSPLGMRKVESRKHAHAHRPRSRSPCQKTVSPEVVHTARRTVSHSAEPVADTVPCLKFSDSIPDLALASIASRKKGSQKEDLLTRRDSESEFLTAAGSNSIKGSVKEALLVLKWGGELTQLGREQARQLGETYRHTMYPGESHGLLRLHSTFRHDLKIYCSDEGRVQTTAAAFAKGFLALEGNLTPILVSLCRKDVNLLDDSSKAKNLMKEVKETVHEIMGIDRDLTDSDIKTAVPTGGESLMKGLHDLKNPQEACRKVLSWINHLTLQLHARRNHKDYQSLDPKEKEVITLVLKRWEKLEKDFFSKKKNRFDISKLPDIYDCVKYDIIHNDRWFDSGLEELYQVSFNLTKYIVPQEYGLTKEEKAQIGRKIAGELVRKIMVDLAIASESYDSSGYLGKLETVHRLDKRFAKESGIKTFGRHVRTRLYFTSESHIHSLLNVLRYGTKDEGIVSETVEEQLGKIPELNYLSQIVMMLFENYNKPVKDPERFMVKMLFSPGVKHVKYPRTPGDESTLSETEPFISLLNEEMTLMDVEMFLNKIIEKLSEDELLGESD